MEIAYTYSEDLELAVTNWDEPSGSYMVRNTRGRVDVADFRVESAGAALVARWHVAPAEMAKVAGFNLYRRFVVGEGEGSPVAKVNDGLLTGSGPAFSYLDRDVLMGQPYDYWLEAVATSGPATTFGPSRGVAVPASVVLRPSYPNPAATSATIPLSLASSAAVDVALYDLAGRRVRTVAEGSLAGGLHKLTVDVSGLPPGVYVVRAAAGDAAAARRMVVAR